MCQKMSVGIKIAGMVARNGCREEIQVGIESGLQDMHYPSRRCMICTVSKNLVVSRNQIGHWQHLSVIESPSDKLSII